MKFEYVGFKPEINQRGIVYKQGKDDKYVYFPYIYEILYALNNDYSINNSYSYDIKMDKANIDELFNMVQNFFPNLENDIQKKLDSYEKHLDLEAEKIKDSVSLSEMDKNIFISNLTLMKDYRIKRAKNKIFYYYSISSIAKIIKKNKIKEIDIPFNEKFWHILKTLQDILSAEKILSSTKAVYIDSSLKLKFTTSLF